MVPSRIEVERAGLADWHCLSIPWDVTFFLAPIITLNTRAAIFSQGQGFSFSDIAEISRTLLSRRLAYWFLGLGRKLETHSRSFPYVVDQRKLSERTGYIR